MLKRRMLVTHVLGEVRPYPLIAARRRRIAPGSSGIEVWRAPPGNYICTVREPAVDVTVVERLIRAIGPRDDAPVTMLLDTYRTATDVLLARIVEAARVHDLEAVRVAAHSLRGTSATLGAVAVADLSARLEEGDVPSGELADAVSALALEQQRFCTDIEPVLAYLAGGTDSTPGGGP